MGTAKLGERIRTVRKRRGLSQKDLAGLSGVSIGLIRKLEQDERDDCRLETLNKLAGALGVRTTDLVVRSGTNAAAEETSSQWAPVRAALMGEHTSAPEEAPTASGLAAALRQAMPLFAGDAFTELGELLPPLIRDADALGKDGRRVRSRLLHLTGWLLTQTRQFEAADLALKRALDDSTDRLDTASTISTLCWLLIRQGKLAEPLELSSKWADEVEPRLSRATDAELSAWGWLLIRRSTAAVRNSDPGEANDSLGLARAAATRLGREYASPGDFLSTFGPVTVAMKRAENLMIEDQPDKVLRLAETIPTEGPLRPTSNNRNRHRLDVAKANLKMRKGGEAFEILQDLRHDSPQWMVNQRLAKDIMGDIAMKRRTLTVEMREMCDFLDLED